MIRRKEWAELASAGQRLAAYLMDLVVLSIIYIALVFLLGLPAAVPVMAGRSLPSYPPIYLLMAAIDRVLHLFLQDGADIGDEAS